MTETRREGHQGSSVKSYKFSGPRLKGTHAQKQKLAQFETGEATNTEQMSTQRQQFGEIQLMDPPTAQPRALLSLDQVADWLGVSKDWVRDHATRRNPRIPVVRLGGKRALLRFRPEDVEQFINSQLQAVN